MEVNGIVHNGVIIPEDSTQLTEGMRVLITASSQDAPRTFGERFAQFKGAIPNLPADLAQQHDHYRLGTPKQ